MRNRAGSFLAGGFVAFLAGTAWGQCAWIALPASSTYSTCVGSPLSLNASVESLDATYQWRRVSDGYVIATGASPTIVPTSPSQSGEYQIIATVPGEGGCVATSPSFTINVGAAAVVSPSAPVEVGVCAGQEMLLEVQAIGPGPYTYQWYKGTSAISDSTRASGTNTPTLRIVNSITSDQGSYYCVAWSSCGNVASGRFTVSVITSFSVVQAPASQLLCGSNAATLSVDQSGLPSGTVFQWYRGSEALVSGGRFAGATAATLSINPVSTDDLQQEFRCALSVPCQTVITPAAIIARDTPMCGLAFDRVATGLVSPVFAFAPPGDFDRLFIVERAGLLRVLDLRTNTVQSEPYLSIPGVRTTGEDGFLGLAFHPRFSENGYFYVNYSNANSDVVIARYRALPPYATSGAADPASATVIAVLDQNGGIHNGGWIGFRPDDAQGYLYISVGEGGSSAAAQDINDVRGSIVRIDVDGPDNVPGNGDDADPVRGTAYRVPPDNPFVATDGMDEILAYGVRNPWRCSFDRDTGDLYIGDVGAGAEEEITLLAADSPASPALNFGWPCIEGRRFSTSSGCVPPPLGTTGPIFANRRNGGCAITGGFVYRGTLIPHLRGYYLFSDYCSGGLFALNVSDAQQGVISEPMPFSLGARMEAQGDAVGNIPALGEDADGEVYVMDSTSIYRVVDLARVVTDCNANGVDDALDISRGIEGDCDGDGVPDSCDSACCPACPADFDQDGGVTGSDISAFFAEYEQGGQCADTDLDGGVTGADIAAFFMSYEAGGC